MSSCRGRRTGQKSFIAGALMVGKMLLWKYHPFCVITGGWSKTPILSNLVTKFPLMSVRTRIWLFNLQENLMNIFKTVNNTLYQFFSCFPAPLLYLALKFLYRKDLYHFPHVSYSPLYGYALPLCFFCMQFLLCTVQLVCWTAKCF